MTEHAAPMPEERRTFLQRLLHAPDEETLQGYLFWGPVVAAILVTEALGAFFDVPWPTISSTVGHLENRWTIVAAIVVGLAPTATAVIYEMNRPHLRERPAGIVDAF